IDDNVHGLRCSTPSGPIELPTTPATAAGPNPRQLFVGSEGTLGIITEATGRIRRVPKAVRAASWFFPDFASGIAALREMEQSGLQVAIARLSDVNETAFGLAQLGSELQRKGVLVYLRARGITTPCLLVVRYDGSAAEVRSRRSQGRSIVRRHKGVNLGAVPETSWEKHRFSTPYLRDQLLREGMIAETLETSAPWSKVEDLHETISADIEKEMADRGTPAFVRCHVLHRSAAGCPVDHTVVAEHRGGRPDPPPSCRRRRPRAVAVGRDRGEVAADAASGQSRGRPRRNHESREAHEWAGQAVSGDPENKDSGVTGPADPKADRSVVPVILNPTARRGAVLKRVDPLVEAFAAHGLEARLVRSTSEEHAQELAAGCAADGARVV